MKVELKPHIGTRRTPLGEVEVVIPQDVIMVEDIWAGYVSHDDNAHISLILSGLTDGQLTEIKEKVDELRIADGRTKTSMIVQAKHLQESNVRVVTEDEISEDDIL